MPRKTPDERIAQALELLIWAVVILYAGPALLGLGILVWMFWPF